MDNNYFGNICYCRRCNGIVHTIKKGDSLYLLSRYYNVPIGEIMNANRHLNIYNLQVGEEICIPIRRSDMLNDNVNNGMNTMPNDNIPNMNMPNNNMPGNVMDNPVSDNGAIESSPNMNNITGGMPGIQIPTDDAAAGGFMFDETESGNMEASCVSSAEEPFDKNIKMSELINQEDMTFEKFLNLIQN